MAGEDVLIGQVVGEYRLVSLLGRGAFGAVYLGQHSSLPSLRVAVKVAHRALAGDQDFVAALRAECASLPFLKHENVATFMQFVSEGPLAPALVLELVEGGSLETRLQQGKQDPAKVWRWLEELLGGLSAAHARGLVHRDIKPGNVLLTDKGSVRLVDFGLARAAERGSSNTATSLAGTLEYVAPEVANGDTASPAADVYAVGLLCWELLMGERACLGGKAGAPAAKILWHVTKGPEALGPRAYGLGIPSNLAGLVDELCAKEVGRRPANAAAALARLHTVRMVGVGTPGPESVGRVPRPAGSGEPGTGPVPVPKVGSGPSPANGPKPAPASPRTPPQTPPPTPPPTVTMPTSPPPQTVQASVEVGKGEEKRRPPEIPAPPVPSGEASNLGWWVLGILMVFMVFCVGVMNAGDSSDNTPATVAPVSVPTPAPSTAPTASGGNVGKLGYGMKDIPAGSYDLGCTSGQSNCESDETQHRVTLTRSFRMGTTEVTQGLYAGVMGTNPSHFSNCGATCPVETVSWVDAAKFANALSQAEGIEACYEITGDTVRWPKGLDCVGYRLPTEAEWEVAARGGADTLYSGGNDLGTVGWFDGNSGNKTHPVGEKGANGYGLYDLSGNVWEWCWDLYGPYGTARVTDPIGVQDGSYRVHRGGSWSNAPARARVSGRSVFDPGLRYYFLGFRLARTIP